MKAKSGGGIYIPEFPGKLPYYSRIMRAMEQSYPASLELPGRTLRGPELTLCVLTRWHIERVVPQVAHLLISVECPGIPEPKIAPAPHRIALLPLRFNDYGYGELQLASELELSMNGREPVFFSEAHAQQIADFVLQHSAAASLVICQCNGGLSRSPAIARALHEHFNAPLKADSREMPIGNQLVFDTLSRVLLETPCTANRSHTPPLSEHRLPRRD